MNSIHRSTAVRLCLDTVSKLEAYPAQRIYTGPSNVSYLMLRTYESLRTELATVGSNLVSKCVLVGDV